MKTQAWGWLAAGVLAAGLNASYHDGGLRWAHQIADQVDHNASAVIALATGRADQFLAEAQVLTASERTSSCPLQKALTQLRSSMTDSDMDTEMDVTPMMAMSSRVVITDRQQAQLDRLSAERDRLEARLARVRTSFAIRPVVIRERFDCPRVRVRVPRVKIPPMPQIHFENSGAGPV